MKSVGIVGEICLANTGFDRSANPSALAIACIRSRSLGISWIARITLVPSQDSTDMLRHHKPHSRDHAEGSTLCTSLVTAESEPRLFSRFSVPSNPESFVISPTITFNKQEVK
jgi:hypothetical protein